MKVGDIIKAVRWCIDEEALNAANINDVSAYDFDGGTHTDLGMMNNIIRNKIAAALRWVCLYAPAEQLSGVSSSSEEEESASIDIIEEEEEMTASNNVLTPTKTLIRVIRVKNETSWHRAILGDSLIKEDSDEYLQLKDDSGATATVDRPQAALRNTKAKKVEVYPAGTEDKFTLTYVRAFTSDDLGDLTDDTTDVGIPANVETSFIYYLAYLLCTAYGDARAKAMFDVATLNLGKTDDKQRA